MKRLQRFAQDLQRLLQAMTRVAWATLQLIGPLILLIWSIQRIVTLIIRGH